MSVYISVELRRQVQADANGCCSYCRCIERVTGVPHEIDHIIAQSLGGETTFENLCSACHQCNKYKGNRVHFPDPQTGKMVALFNPRVDLWREHFRWNRNSTMIIGLTPSGRATIDALQLNNEYALRARHLWVLFGTHPPQD